MGEQTLQTGDGQWRAKLAAWKTHAVFYHSVGASVLVEHREWVTTWPFGRTLHWVKRPVARIHLRVDFGGRSADRRWTVYDRTEDGAGYREHRATGGGISLTFDGHGNFGIGGGGGLTLPSHGEPLRTIWASGDVGIPGYQSLYFSTQCAGDLCA